MGTLFFIKKNSLSQSFFGFLVCAALPGTGVLSAVISTINGHNKVALMLCWALDVTEGQLQAHIIMEGKALGLHYLLLSLNFCRLS